MEQVTRPKERRPALRYLALSLAATIVLCLLWTLWLLCLTLVPNATINRLMSTADLDVGLFWLFVDAAATTQGLGGFGLAVVALAHVYILVKAIRHSKSQRQRSRIYATTNDSPPADTTTATPSSRFMSSQKLKSFQQKANQFSDAALDPQSTHMRFTAVALKLADIVLQCVVLIQFMNNGLDKSLTVLFAGCIVLNALCTAVIVSTTHKESGITHLVFDFVSDMIVAVVFPLVVLATAFFTFSFDCQLMELNNSIFPVGSFERAASVIANPVEIMRIRFAIDAFRINSLSKAFTRVGTNLALCFRSYKLSELLYQNEISGAHPSVYPSRNRALGAVFVVIAVVVIVFTERSITTSSTACAPHPECALYAHKWLTNVNAQELTRCPCIAVVDRDITVARYDDWVNPPNRTEKLAQLATLGGLQAVQFVNRGISFLPDQLRDCTELRYLSLYYTGNLTLPDWFGDFASLEFLHIEGVGSMRSLHALREGLFDKMESLALVHLAAHPFRSLPSFDNLRGLRSINLAALMNIASLPRFDSLANLERLVLSSMTGLQTTPKLDHARKLSTFVSFDRGAYCCNGFLGPHRSNLSHSLCKTHPLFRTPAITACLPPSMQASEGTRATFDRFSDTACFSEALQPGKSKGSPTLNEMELCGGIMYRECRLPGSNVSAMCYNARWMGVGCDRSPFSIEMRRQQITQKRGTPCDPAFEAWLGCKST